jgi:coenzyme Q-binding protein COQ10
MMQSEIRKTTGILPFTREQAFDLAADIERYPEFLRGWVSARIHTRESNHCCVDQVVGIGPFRLQFMSKAVLHRPEQIEVTSTQAPFRLFSLVWRITAAPLVGCRASIIANIELRSRIMRQMVNGMLPDMMDEVIAAFEARAHRVYATGSQAGNGKL